MHPIDNYLTALAQLQKGKKEEAVKHLSMALGSKEPTSVIRNNAERILDINSTAHGILLPLIAHESRKY